MASSFFAVCLLLSITEGFIVFPTPKATTFLKKNVDTRMIKAKANNDEKDPRAYLRDSETRGAILFGTVLLINVWLFSIPPSFRRTEICLTPNTGPRADCSTWNEFFADVKTYYENGGGIQFDFSIDPAKKAAFFHNNE
mmetsp:Transcript_7711/g.10728  ORF Transcript_7711/g.10728 Transcript_7711/m.10728 type:complete len:139 (-) Transcript_7711:2375-2791(-)